MVKEIILFVVLSIIYTIIFNYKDKISKILNLIDTPDNKRKIHSKPTPLLGGLIIFIFVIINFSNFKIYLPNKELLIFFSLFFLYFFLSIIDDIRGLNSYFRLIFLFIFTYLILNNSEIFILKNLNFKFQYLSFNFEYLSVFLTTLCILLLVNALNLSDGINGLSTLLIIFWTLYIKIFLFNDYSYLGVSSLIILILVFYHIYKGFYFMGDYGVTVAALIIGLGGIASYNLNLDKPSIIFVEELFLLFFVPGLDMLRLFIERILKRKDPFSADSNHLHHILINKFKLKKSLIIYMIISFSPIVLFKLFELNTLILIGMFTFFYFLFFFSKLRNIFN